MSHGAIEANRSQSSKTEAPLSIPPKKRIERPKQAAHSSPAPLDYDQPPNPFDTSTENSHVLIPPKTDPLEI
ncbi:hypothetical protein PGT21_020426 [Puccinia graminis f. sp. tritici]|uniref:Uncharacterized protein n=1 Tax=Puccinia graminis f. sp. tritici TaxID=56615 RepID=A0A5B0MN63_PUCGR|nr:hypothetical protein PGT21_020426 [Puccinia graminis f. sp. tritici]